MSYVNPDYPTKKAFKAAIAAGKKHYTYSHAGIFEPTQNGSDCIEGPHYPKPHRWYASVKVQDGIVVECEKIKLGSAKPAVQEPSELDVFAVSIARSDEE